MKPLLLCWLLLLAVPAEALSRSRNTSDLSPALKRATLYHAAIKAAATRHSVDPHLLWTIGYLETRFQPRCVSPKGARGMMQFIPSTGRRYGLLTRRDLHDPLLSIDAAARYVRDLNAIFGGRIDLVLAGYNAGEYAVISSRYRVPPYRETRSYVARGLSVFKRITEVDILASRPIELTTTTSGVIERRRQTLSITRPSRSIYFR
ncbi:MAG: lytic transglycosylase domain-containing protein [Acidobacteriota bacterium]